MEPNANLVRRVTIWPLGMWTKDYFTCRDSARRTYCLPKATIRFGKNGIKRQLQEFYPNAKIIVDLCYCNGVFECTMNQGRIIPSKITSPLFDQLNEISIDI